MVIQNKNKPTKDKIEQLKIEASILRDGYFQLKKMHKFNQILIDTIPFGMHIINNKGKIIFLNKKFEEQFGKDAIGKKCWEVYSKHKKQPKNCLLKKGVNTGETGEVEITECMKGRVLQINYTGIKYKGQKAILEIFQDITERKKAEEEIKALDQLKNKFINVVSHQLRTPLTGIKWNIEILLKGRLGKLKKEQKELLRSCYEAEIAVMDRLADLLLVLDIEEGRIVLKKEIISIESLYKSVMGGFKQKIDLKQIAFSYKVPPRPLLQISVDRDKIRSVFVHLIKNAVEYTKEKGKISTKLMQGDNNIRFEIKDTGIGIPKVEQPRIFTRFFRASNASVMETDRTGIGLAIAKFYIEEHGGKIGFDSIEGKGSTFWFELPIEEE